MSTLLPPSAAVTEPLSVVHADARHDGAGGYADQNARPFRHHPKLTLVAAGTQTAGGGLSDDRRPETQAASSESKVTALGDELRRPPRDFPKTHAVGGAGSARREMGWWVGRPHG